MSTITEWPGLLRAAASTVKGVRAYDAPGERVDPPAVMVGPPSLRWDGFQEPPTEATFTVYVLVAFDTRAVERLVDLVPRVAAAIDTGLADATVRSAEPGTFMTGSSELPAYLLRVEVVLS